LEQVDPAQLKAAHLFLRLFQLSVVLEGQTINKPGLAVALVVVVVVAEIR
jgi:hypothetical protein